MHQNETTLFWRELKATLAVALPICGSQVGQMLFGILDSVMVGRLGPAPLAASALVHGLFGFFLVFGFGIATAIAVLISEARSSEKPKLIGETLRHGVILHALLGVVLFVAMELVGFALPWLKQAPEVEAEALDYLHVTAFSMIPLMAYVAFRQFAEGLSFPSLPMWILAAGLTLNAGINWVLIFGNFGFPALGLVGAGIGTLIARVFMLGLMIYFVLRLKRFKKYLPEFWFGRWSGRRFRKILKLGLPSGFQYVFEIAAFASATVMMGWLGAKMQAAHSIALSLASMTFMVAMGVASASAIRVGHHVGLKDDRAVRAVGFGSMAFVIFFMASCGLALTLFRHQLPWLFIDDVDVVRIAERLILLVAFFQIADGTQAVGVSLLRGIKDTTFPTIATLASYVLLTIPMSYIFGFVLNFNENGVWLGLIVGLFIIALLLTTRFIWLTSAKRWGKPVVAL